MEDLTLKDLLKLTMIGGGVESIEAYQQMHAFQSSMEAIQHMPGHTQKEWNEVSESIRKLAQPEHE